MPDSLLIRNGMIAPTSENSAFEVQDLRIVNGRIAEIGAELIPAGEEIVDATGGIVLPGLIDTHVHMWQHPWREVASRLWGFGDYAKVFWPLRDVYEPEDTFDAITGCAWDLINHGVTGAIDFFHGANFTPAHADAALAAHRKAGLRVQLTYGATAAYGASDAAGFERSRLERLADFARLRAEVERSGEDLVTIGLALVTPSDELMGSFFSEVQTAREAGARMSFHQNRPGEIAAIYERGLLGPDIVAVHSNTVSDEELRWMAEARMPIASTPQSEVSLGWSMTVMRRALAAGVPLGIGVDTPGTLPIDLFGQLRIAKVVLQLLDAIPRWAQGTGASNPPTVTFDDVLRFGTTNGGIAMGREGELGVLATGAAADLIVVKPADPEPALRDPSAHLVLAATPAEVDTVIIGGAVRKRAGQLVGVDADSLRAANTRVRNRVLARARL